MIKKEILIFNIIFQSRDNPVKLKSMENLKARTAFTNKLKRLIEKRRVLRIGNLVIFIDTRESIK